MTVEAPAAPAPVVPAPAPAPAAVTPTVTPTPAANPTPGNVAPPAEPVTSQSLLESAGKEAPKPGDVKPGDKTQGAPETYSDFTLPDGITLDAKLADGFKALAKEMNLSQENAQKLATLQAEHVKTTADSLVKEAEQQRTKQLEAWKTETKTALGADWQKELGFAGKALDAFGGPELRKLLTESGLGDHPLMAKMLVAVGKTMSETQPGEGTRVAIDDPKESQYRGMFPKMYDGNGLRK